MNDFVDLGPRLLADEGSGGAEMLDFDELGTWHKGFLKSIKSISPEGKIGIDLDVGDQLIADISFYVRPFVQVSSGETINFPDIEEPLISLPH